MPTVRRSWLVTAGLLTALLLTGCSADSAEDAGAAPESGAASGDQEAPERAGAGTGQDGGGEAGGAFVDARAIIYTGEITVRVVDMDQSARAVTALAGTYDGFVGGDRRSMDRDEARATIVLRVPSGNFTEAVAALGDLGEELSREIGTDDVTEEIVDLETRIATARASLDRTRQLMERAESISEIVSMEEELTKREGALASLQARQRELADLTALSTITVRLLEPAASAAAPAEPRELGFLPGLRAGWGAFTGAMTVLVTILGALLPWLVAAGVPAAAAIWWSRRRRALSPAAPPDASAG